jgi:hypothetical protein
MANIRKSFNLRNGVQVDDDNFIVNSNGLVGIGTSVPQAFLDIRSSNTADAVKIVGHTTATTLYTGIATIGGLTVTQSLNVSGVVTATSFSGSATGLTDIYAVAVDGWYIDSGNSSISTTFKVGIGTTNPLYSLQIGDPDSTEGISFNAATGDIVSTGGIAATSFYGDLDAGYLTGTISNSRLPDISVGIVTATTGFYGNLTGTASTANSITSTANITVNSINSGFSTSGISTVYTTLHVVGNVGVGTLIPNAQIHIRKSGISSIQLTSDGSNPSILTLGRNKTSTSNNAQLRFGNTSGSYPSSTEQSFDIINYDTGNLNFYLNPGGAGTGSYNWFSPSLTNLVTLTSSGNLGIGVLNPTTKLQVSGIASVTTLNVTGSLYATGVGETATVRSLYVLNGQSGVLDSQGNTLFNRNVNIESGISTFNSIYSQNIGIGSETPTQPLDVIGNVKITGGNLYVGINTVTGIILTSNNGTQYRLFVQDNGTLSTEAV